MMVVAMVRPVFQGQYYLNGELLKVERVTYQRRNFPLLGRKVDHVREIHPFRNNENLDGFLRRQFARVFDYVQACPDDVVVNHQTKRIGETLHRGDWLDLSQGNRHVLLRKITRMPGLPPFQLAERALGRAFGLSTKRFADTALGVLDMLTQGIPQKIPPAFDGSKRYSAFQRAFFPWLQNLKGEFDLPQNASKKAEPGIYAQPEAAETSSLNEQGLKSA